MLTSHCHSWHWSFGRVQISYFFRMSLTFYLSEVSSWLDSVHAFYARITKKWFLFFSVQHIRSNLMSVCSNIADSIKQLVKLVSARFLYCGDTVFLFEVNMYWLCVNIVFLIKLSPTSFSLQWWLSNCMLPSVAIDWHSTVRKTFPSSLHVPFIYLFNYLFEWFIYIFSGL